MTEFPHKGITLRPSQPESATCPCQAWSSRPPEGFRVSPPGSKQAETSEPTGIDTGQTRRNLFFPPVLPLSRVTLGHCVSHSHTFTLRKASHFEDPDPSMILLVMALRNTLGPPYVEDSILISGNQFHCPPDYTFSLIAEPVNFSVDYFLSPNVILEFQ